jgi:hypothetical protein
MDQTVSQRFEPSSRTTLMGEQPNPWDVLPPQDVMSRHRGAKPSRRCELLGKISLFGYVLSYKFFVRQEHSLNKCASSRLFILAPLSIFIDKAQTMSSI